VIDLQRRAEERERALQRADDLRRFDAALADKIDEICFSSLFPCARRHQCAREKMSLAIFQERRQARARGP